MKKILIVDDSLVMRKMLRTELSKQDYEVLEAQNGKEGLLMASKEQPDMIISDINMPVMDGWDFCWKIKKDPTLNQIPFIFLSANNEVSDRVKGIELGADDYIIKPFSPQELLARVQSLFQRYKKEEKFPRENRSLTGNLAKMNLPSLLQFLNMNSMTGILHISSGDSIGKIYIQDGDIIHSETPPIAGKKALFRILSWKEGIFSFEEGLENPERRFQENSLKLIMDGLKQQDELDKIREGLPKKDQEIRMDMALLEDPDFGPEMQEFFQVVAKEKVVGKILDKSPLTDLQIYQIIDLMLQEGLFELVSSS
ncbi:MAG: response regulator [Planctomycetota bacterium]|nr:MAG: response regulator [Planctomycetota bacterium]